MDSSPRSEMLPGHFEYFITGKVASANLHLGRRESSFSPLRTLKLSRKKNFIYVFSVITFVTCNVANTLRNIN